MRKRFITFIFLCVFPVIGIAQTDTDSPLNSIPDSLFAATQYPAHPNEPFIYALKKLDISFEETSQSIVAVLQYHVRVKIFDSSVKEAAVVGIPYYFESSIEEVSDINAVTWQSPDEKVPLSTNQVRTINVNSRYNVKEFTMPAVQDGSVIEYTYTVRRRYIEELPDFYLAHQVPTQRAEVSITYPRYLRYSGIVQDFSGRVHHQTFQKSGNSNGDVPKIFMFPQPDPIVQEAWWATDIPAVESESYITSLDDYRGRIKFQLSEFGIPRQTLENSWDFVVAEIRRKQQINARIDANERAREIGASINRTLGDKKAVQDSIFQYLNQTVNYSGSKAPFSTSGDDPVLEGNSSDQAAINQTLAAMLQGAEIDASPVLISTRESGQINRDFPSFFQFNGQLIYTEIDGQPYFMDASFPNSYPNLIPVDMFNENGLLLRQSSYDWIDIQPSESVFAIDVDIKAELDRQGNLSGSLQARNSGYPARQIRMRLAEGAPVGQVIKDAVLDGYTNAAVREAQFSQIGSGETQLSANFALQDYAVSFTDGLEFPPMVVGFLRENPFDGTKRDLPITLDAPEQLNLSYIIQLPEGMSLAQQPQDQSITMPGAGFRETYDTAGNVLRYEFHIDISQKQFSPGMYGRLLNLYNRWVQLSNSQWRIVR